MQKDISIVLRNDTEPAVKAQLYNGSATIFELVAVRALSISMSSLYKNAIDALYDQKSKRFYHDYDFPQADELKELLNDEEMQRIHGLSPFKDMSTAFADPNFNGITDLTLRDDMNQFKFMSYDTYRQISLPLFRKSISLLNLDELFDFIHDNHFQYLFPEEYEELDLSNAHDHLENWLNYFVKLHISRTKSDVSQFLEDWIIDTVQLNKSGVSQDELNTRLKNIGLSERIVNAVVKVKNSNNPVATLSPILVPQKMDYVVVKNENIKYVGH